MIDDAAESHSRSPSARRHGRERTLSGGRRRTSRTLAAAAVLLGVGIGGALLERGRTHPARPPAPPPPLVTVSPPLRLDVPERASFLGQFSAVDRVEIRAQVGGILSEIHFRDGEIVHKGDLLFVIDPRPYEIRLAAAVASVKSAKARLDLADAQLWRAQQLKRTEFGTAETVDQRLGERRAAEAAFDTAKQSVRDAQLDLEYCHVTAPFSGRISNHLVSIGNLVSGSRAGSSPTTLLTTLVSLDPIYLDFDMSENDFLSYQRTHAGGKVGGTVVFRLGDEDHEARHGTLDFIDNAVDRSSGTIHARATVDNHDLFLVPGEFARLSLEASKARPALLVPDASVMPDQSQFLVLTVAPDGTVIPKPVVTGSLLNGLRIVRAGLSPDDRVIIDGLMHAQPGGKVKPAKGTIQPMSADRDQG